ncbi:hypothetical protein DL93DRAFT_2030388, partial [Clavulina sp. PMI_390]
SEPSILPDAAITLGDNAKFLREIRAAYPKDSVFRRILNNPGDHRLFTVDDGLIFHRPSPTVEPVLCVPDSTFQGRRAREVIIDIAHTTVGHLAALRTGELIRRSYWW